MCRVADCNVQDLMICSKFLDLIRAYPSPHCNPGPRNMSTRNNPAIKIKLKLGPYIVPN